MTADVARLLTIPPGNDALWPVYERRLDAYHNAQAADLFQRVADDIVRLYPAKSKQIYRRLAKTCENAGARECVDAAHEKLKTPAPATLNTVPPAHHRVPPEWSSAIPSGAVTAEERLFLLELAGLQLQKQGHLERAEAMFLEALERAESRLYKNTLHMRHGKLLEEAKYIAGRFYEDLAEREGENDPRTLNRLAWYLLSDGKVDRGFEIAQRAATATSNSHPSILDTLAEAYLRKGDRAKARELIQRCIELDPERDYFRNRLRAMK